MSNSIIPKKLSSGDEVRIIAPSKSLANIKPSAIKLAKARLERFGLKIIFGKNVYKKDIFGSSSVKQRLADLEDAFKDKKVKMVLAATGGYNTNQLLDYLDFNLIKKNPKFFCGFSDITVLLNAITDKTRLVTYHGPTLSFFCKKQGLDYSLKSFEQTFLIDQKNINIKPSTTWGDNFGQKKKTDLKFYRNPGWWPLQTGKVKGKILGGNLCTLNLLQGTPYWPNLKGSILFLEDDDLAGDNTPVEFERNLQSLVQVPGFKGVRAVVFGRFKKASTMTRKKLIVIVRNQPALKQLPIVANLDFGHTVPQFFLPVGAIAELLVSPKTSSLVFEMSNFRK